MTETITPKELKERKDEFVVIDVREEDEISKGTIDGAIHMPLGSVLRNAKQRKLDHLKGKKIVTHCNSGYRGNIAAEELRKAGFQAMNLEGGFKAWMEEK